MNWKELYDSKIVTVEEAVKNIKNNDNVVFSQTASVPLLTALTLYENRELYDNVSIYHMFTLGHGEYMRPECYGHFRHFGNFAASNSRQALMDKRADLRYKSLSQRAESLLAIAHPEFREELLFELKKRF